MPNHPTNPNADRRGDPIRVMIVEESVTAQRWLTEEIGAHPRLSVAGAVGSGEEALEALNDLAPDLIFIDDRLPGMCGDAVCRELRARADTDTIAIVMLTPDDPPEIEARTLESGSDAFVRKPADPEPIILRAKALLGGSRVQSKIPHPTGSRIRRPRILAVDDSPAYLAHLSSELQGEAYELETTSDPAHALELVASTGFECVLVDLGMPEISGDEICRRIKQGDFPGDVRPTTLMLTAQDEREDLARALDAGADDFVGKSSDTTVLKARIRTLLRRKHYEEENARILAELRDKQLQIERARMEREAAETRGELIEQLRRTAIGLRETNADLEHFAYVASHDLQEPLRMVASYLQLLESRGSDRLNDEDRECVAYAVNGARRLKRLIADLLEYSCIRTQGNPFCSVAMSPVFDHVSASIDAPGSELTRGELPRVAADADQIGQLLRHLLDNAVKFRGNAPPRVHVEATEGEHDWTFTVTDNGIGIDPQYADRIFTIFQRLHTQEAYPGTGAGLAICKRIVERHGGQIWVEPTDGPGSAFRFTLLKSPTDLHKGPGHAEHTN